MNKFSDNISDAAYDTADKIKSRSQDVYEKTADKASDLADKVSDKSEQLMESKDKMVKEYSGWIRDNPMTAVTLAAGIGMVLSKLSR